MVQIITTNWWWGWWSWGCSEWGCITGTLCNQTDLQSALNCKADCSAIPTDNCQLANWCGYTTCTGTVVASDLSAYQKTACMVCDLTGADNNHYPSAKAVADAISGWGAWDMLKAVYDPNNHNADAFDYCNFTNTPTIPTDNCQLSNSCGYITSAALSGYAQTCDIPTDNCQLGNSCWYTTCTWTLTASNISDTAYWSSWNGVTTVAPSKNAVYDKICTIDSLISTNATSSNKLMDKNYIDDSINSVTAYYITKNAQGDQFATYAELAAATTFYSWWVARTPTRNDYTIVLDDETHSHELTRYIYNSWWEYQYSINESPMTQAQLDALNSWITAAKVCAYDAIPVITDNCQIGNGCWYTTCTWTLSSCADVISALWYTPYSSANPSWYTSCTWTLTAADITWKLDKVTTTNTYWRVYWIATDGSQVTVCISPWLVSNTLVRRSWTQVIVPNTPTDTCHATSKCYVDSVAVPSWWCCWQVLTNTWSGCAWCAASWGDFVLSSQCCNILTTWVPIWAWCQCDYDNLGTYCSNWIYFII